MGERTTNREAAKIDDRVYPFISVIIPVRNEAESIGAVIESLLQQDCPNDSYEIIVVDGESEDNTREVVEGFASRHPQISLLNNPRRLSSAGKNIGVESSRGEVVLFVDGHCHLPSPELLQEVARLYLDDRERVLCRPQPLDYPGNNPFQSAVAACRATAWGHGLDSTIYAEEEGEVNPTTSGAAYPQELFRKIGHLDESFDACEDVEFNYRCHRAGYNGFISPKLKICYQPRRNSASLFRQMYRYGLGRFRFLLKHPQSFTPWQLAPALLVLLLPLTILALLAGDPWITPFLSIWLVYFLLTSAFSISIAAKHGPDLFFRSPPIFFTIHAGLGFGFLAGLGEVILGRRPTATESPTEVGTFRIKVMFIIDSLPNRKAGTEKVLSSLIENLNREVFEPILCCLHGSRNLRFQDTRSLNLGMQSFASFKALKELFYLAGFLKRREVDLLVTFFKNANYFGTLAAKLSGRTRVVSCRRNLGYWQSWRDLLLLRTINRWTEFVIANSIAVKEAVMMKEEVQAERIGVIYNGIDLQEFSNKLIPREEAKKRHGVTPQTPIVGTVSNLRPVKQLHIFLESALIISRRFPETKFFLVGEGPQRRELESLVGHLGLTDSVVFAGGTGEVAPYLSAFDVGVLSSSSEGFSNSILEYMLAGLPVVATSVGGNPEIIADGKNGYLVPPGNPRSLADKIILLLGEKELRTTLGQEALSTVRERFSLTRMLAQFEECFLKLCGGEHIKVKVGDADEERTTYPGREKSEILR
jgi:succinoglycan biosynthesis protein ExoA